MTPSRDGLAFFIQSVCTGKSSSYVFICRLMNQLSLSDFAVLTYEMPDEVEKEVRFRHTDYFIGNLDEQTEAFGRPVDENLCQGGLALLFLHESC